ncbi:hypothetical protein [Stackebrandtia nassauensis]|uniref:Uncharacterized protein n=1 Tax=Stackebrandtia nassauensis (strain DSM 44728 / CIP 108903 / NRRL B-16338 / NBRC 102104 / LLR-40K-21) TaxID=446470 RepID=D3Q4L8_STANL|nr:hypothetical protein [Stackebrandtia nassauensis]ADD40178.1 hypothetical protein Snas_0463 [Stackebrandtia nassauensis DSM 44728]
MYDIPESERQRIRGAQAGPFVPLVDWEANPFADPPRSQPYDAELPLRGFASEKALADRVLARLEPWFVIDREVRGTHCCGKHLRVDAMLRPRNAQVWADPDVAFGVEFKQPPLQAGENAYTKWLAQAVDYTHVDWDNYGHRLIFTCPGAAAWLDTAPAPNPHADPNRRRDVHIAKRLAGQLNLGELVLRWSSGLTFLLNGENIWSERFDVSNGRSWKLRRKIGSR